MRSLFGGTAFGAAAYLVMAVTQVPSRLPVAILAGALFAWFTAEE
jgi:hypothetical protein